VLRLEVHWIDSGTAHSDGWQTSDAIMERVRIGKVITVGLLMGETDDTLYMALSYDPDHDQYINAQAIAKSSIISREVLRQR
jgi:hypothetical protein